MINNLGKEVRWSGPRWKYGSALSEYLNTGDYDADMSTGSVEWGRHIRQYGKRLLVTTQDGFVNILQLPTIEAATALFEEADNDYCDWVETEERWFG